MRTFSLKSIFLVLIRNKPFSKQGISSTEISLFYNQTLFIKRVLITRSMTLIQRNQKHLKPATKWTIWLKPLVLWYFQGVSKLVIGMKTFLEDHTLLQKLQQPLRVITKRYIENIWYGPKQASQVFF